MYIRGFLRRRALSAQRSVEPCGRKRNPTRPPASGFFASAMRTPECMPPKIPPLNCREAPIFPTVHLLMTRISEVNQGCPG
jgi:hypothetical protein